LVEGSVPEGDRGIRLCERGHHVAVYPGDGLSPTILVLQPSGKETDAAASDAAPGQTQAVASLWQQFERLAQESQGLAMELISSYEQLNVIFDITKRVGEVRNVEEIKLFLVRILTEALSCDWACCLSEDGDSHWWCRDDRSDRATTLSWLQQGLQDVLKKVSGDRQIVVLGQLPGPQDGQPTSVMAGPLGSDAEITDVVVVARGSDRDEFLSGDMRMLDSVLSHGGQVISNLRLMERLKRLSFEAVLALVSAIDKKDSYTSGHSERVGFLSHLIGEEMGLAVADLQDLEWAGILHDVGKIGISDGILTKPGSLTDDEFDLIREHPKMSYQVIEPLRSFKAVRDTVLHHHETPDGTGYPDGLKGDEIPLGASIVHTADTFDALTSDRSYRRSFPIEKALEIMRQDTGTKIDQKCMAAFERAFKVFRKQQPDRFRELFGHTREHAE